MLVMNPYRVLWQAIFSRATATVPGGRLRCSRAHGQSIQDRKQQNQRGSPRWAVERWISLTNHFSFRISGPAGSKGEDFT